METVKQADREAAATKIKGDDCKAIAMRAAILVGEADQHPAVQGAAFYRVANEIADRIKARIAESENPYDHGEEQYLAGLRDALALVKQD